MTTERYMSEYLGTFELSARDHKLHELAARYHAETEAYDRTVCTGPIRAGSIMPMTTHEMALINRNAIKVREMIIWEAAREGISRTEMARAISRAA